MCVWSGWSAAEMTHPLSNHLLHPLLLFLFSNEEMLLPISNEGFGQEEYWECLIGNLSCILTNIFTCLMDASTSLVIDSSSLTCSANYCSAVLALSLLYLVIQSCPGAILDCATQLNVSQAKFFWLIELFMEKMRSNFTFSMNRVVCTHKLIQCYSITLLVRFSHHPSTQTLWEPAYKIQVHYLHVCCHQHGHWPGHGSPDRACWSTANWTNHRTKQMEMPCGMRIPSA